MASAWSFIRRDLAWPITVAALIIAASHRPHLASPEIVNIDKVTHFAVYGLFATLVCRLGRGWRAATWTLLVAAGFGALDEWHQSFVPGRSPEWADWIADTLGATLAVALYTAWTTYRGWLESPVFRPSGPTR